MSITFQQAMDILQIVLLILLGLSTCYILFFSITGLFYRQPVLPDNEHKLKMAVLIPGYKEDDVIVGVAREALRQDYPADKYDVVVIADSFSPNTLTALRELPIRVIEVSFEKSTKSKALNKAMEQLDDSYEVAVILDADNVMAADFLKRINAVMKNGFKAVQGHRTAKNMNTNLAVLDAVSEEINNHIFRKGHRVAGLSSAIIGSGMAFQYGYFKTMMATVKAVGGFDKEIELKMLRAGDKIAYLNDAFVYDEKVQKAEVFSNQRRRWLSAQLHYFRQDIFQAIWALVTRGNVDYFDKAIQFIQPPRILLLGAVILFGSFFSVFNLIYNNDQLFLYLWACTMLGCIMAFLFSIPGNFYNMKTAKALLSLPKGMFLMFGSLLKIKGANKKFLHTSHSSNSVEVKP